MENSGTPRLEMEGVRIAFAGREALRGLSFQVWPGEIFGFLGPSGAGKTTTIKLLTRQLQADAGLIRVFGQEIRALPQSAFERIGVLTDTSGVYERLSVYDNLALFSDLHRLPRSAVDEALEQVELSGEKKKIAKNLSRGMMQRVALARATLHKPALLFLDEPTASLDPGTTHHIHKMLRALREGGTTIFLTTHDMEEADKLCDRVAFLHSGEIVALDTSEALKLRYARSEIVARLAGGGVQRAQKSAEGLRQIAALADGDALLTLHSQEPSLEDIFLQLTGRDLA